MKGFKKLLLLIMIFVLAISCSCVVLADEATEGDDVQVISNFDEYQQLLNDNSEGSYISSDYAPYDTSSSSSSVTNGELKEYYDEYQQYLIDYYNEFSREKAVRAIVTEAGISREEFNVADYYSVSKYILQEVKVRILEGDHIGEEIKLDYLLSADSLNNILLAPLHVGDKIFVNLTEEDGVLTGEISNSWSTVDRINMIICIGAIIAILLLIYAGKKGLNTIFVTTMVILSCIVIIPLYIYNGSSALGIAVFVMLALIASISMAHLGVNKTALKAMCISLFMCGITMLLAIAMMYITRTVGTLFEFAAIAENVILKNIDFTAVFYAGILVISAGVISNTVAMCVSRIDRESADNFEEKTNLCREVVLSNVVMVALLLFVAYIPNHLLLYLNKFNNYEVINSETLICEFIRVFAIQISIVLCSPVVSLDNFKFGKKYLSTPEDKKEE